MFISGLLLPVSGIMNHNLQFEKFAIERHFWMSVHNMTAFLFSVMMIMHVIYNRKTLIGYIKNYRSITISKEAIYALVLVLAIVGLFSSHALHIR